MKVRLKIYSRPYWTTIHLSNPVGCFSITNTNEYSFSHEVTNSDDIYKHYPITYNLRKAFKRFIEFETCWRKYIDEN
jgi:hypothetical protein